MKNNYIVLLTILFFITSSIYAQEKARNNIIVFDITGSMVGKPDNSNNKNIWQPSLRLLEKQLKSFPKNEKITLYLFGENLSKIGDYQTNDVVGASSSIIREIDSIKVNGLTQKYTCIYKSLDSIIEKLDKKYINTIYLFTDGKNSDGHGGCGTVTAQELALKWENETKKNEYLFIYKLKSFNLPGELNGETIKIIENSLSLLNIAIEPINTVIRISKNNLNSSQQFRITGTGSMCMLPNDLIIRTSDIKFKGSNSENEIANTRPNSLAQL